MDNIFTFQGHDVEEEPYQVPFSEFKEDKLQAESPQPFLNKPYVFEQFDEEEGQNAEIRHFQQYMPSIRQPFSIHKKRNNQGLIKKMSVEQPMDTKGKDFLVRHSSQLEKKVNKENKSVLRGVEVQDVNVREMQYVCEKKAIKVTDLRKFLNTPLGDYKVKAILKKESFGFFNTKTKFTVYIEQNNKFLMTVLRDGFSDYIFSLSKENVSTKNKNYLGMMSGNISGTQFSLFDSGFSPKDTRALEQCRKQLGFIKYEESKGPRKFQVLVTTNGNGFHALQTDQNILQEKWVKKQREYLSKLYSKCPQFDLQEGNYKLDFKGIVKKASVKNFILGGTQWEDSLIFGKVDDNTFVMEIKQPFSVMQATAICISSIQYKLHWG